MSSEDYLVNKNEIKVFVFYLTNCCNLSCKHCLFNCSPSRNDFIDYKRFCEIIHDIKENFSDTPLQIGFSGGEISMHPDWKKFIKVCRDSDFTLGIVTNGTSILPEDIPLLKDPGIQLAISVDGFERDHDYLRGAGQFNNVLSTLDLLAKNDIVFNLNTAVTPRSLERLPQFIDFMLARYDNIPTISIQNIISAGKARFFKDLVLSPEDSYELFYMCQQLKTRYLQTSFQHFLHQREYIMKHPCKVFACSGKNCHSQSSDIPVTFNILSDGEVIPLWAALDTHYSIGNINNKPLSTLLNSYLHKERHYELLDFIKKVFQQEIDCNRTEKIVDWASIIITQSNGKTGGSDN